MGHMPESMFRHLVVAARDLVPITPHATNPNEYVALYIGGAGNIEVVTASGRTVIVPVGQGYFLQGVQRVLAANTTATHIFGVVL